MNDTLISAENIQTSSNSLTKSDLFSGDSPWISRPDDLTPTVLITLSDSDNITITKVKLVDPMNVKTYNVTVYNLIGNTVHKEVSSSYSFNTLLSIEMLQILITTFNFYLDIRLSLYLTCIDFLFIDQGL